MVLGLDIAGTGTRRILRNTSLLPLRMKPLIASACEFPTPERAFSTFAGTSLDVKTRDAAAQTPSRRQRAWQVPNDADSIARWWNGTRSLGARVWTGVQTNGGDAGHSRSQAREHMRENARWNRWYWRYVGISEHGTPALNRWNAEQMVRGQRRAAGRAWVKFIKRIPKTGGWNRSNEHC